MLHRVFLICASTLFLTSGISSSSAWAAIVSFDTRGVFDNGESLAGTLTIDTVLGSVLAADLTLSPPLDPNPSHLDRILDQGVLGSPQGDYFVSIGGATIGYTTQVVLDFYNTDSLIGYTGGPLKTDSSPPIPGRVQITSYLYYVTYDPGTTIHTALLTSGSLTVASVPEPSSVVMLGVGACGLIGAVVRRRRAT